MDVTRFGNDPFQYIDTITNSFFGFLSGFPRFFFRTHGQSLSLRIESSHLMQKRELRERYKNLLQWLPRLVRPTLWRSWPVWGFCLQNRYYGALAPQNLAQSISKCQEWVPRKILLCLDNRLLAQLPLRAEIEQISDLRQGFLTNSPVSVFNGTQ